MKIACLLNRLSGVKSGAHLATLEIARGLAGRGHTVRFGSLKGERVSRLGDKVSVGTAAVRALVAWAEWIIVRDEPKVGKVLPYCQGKRVLYSCHSPAGAPQEWGVKLPRQAVVVFVSSITRDAVKSRGEMPYAHRVIEGNAIDLEWVKTTPGQRVTLINLSSRKGGDLFWRLVSAMPDVSFLGVRGWGDQVVPETIPPNALVWDKVPQPRKIFAETRILLIPSAEMGRVECVTDLPAWQEAWSRVGVEAAASGIPVIAHPSPGVRAALGDAAIWLDRDDDAAWVQEIRLLADPEFYAMRSARALARAEAVRGTVPEILDQYEAVLRGGT